MEINGHIKEGDLIIVKGLWMDDEIPNGRDLEPLLHVTEIDHRLGYVHVTVMSGKDIGSQHHLDLCENLEVVSVS